MSITVIIDGDVICYGACPNRWGSVIDKSVPPPTFTLQQDMEYLETCQKNLDTIIKQLQETTFADTTRIAIKGDGNFRHDVFPGYKANRSTTVRPVNMFVNMLRDYAEEKHGAVKAHGMEADDLLHIWYHEEIALGNLPIIASIDKDLLCIPGKHYRFPKGNLYENGSRSPDMIIDQDEWSAQKHYYKQLLMGDSTDGIPGLPKVGPKRADAILAECKNESELQYMTIYAYKEIIGEKWKDELMLTGQLITIKPSFDYIFSIEGWKGND